MGRWVSAEPAADFADLFAPLWRKVLDAADPAPARVIFLGALVWDNAEPAADLAFLLECRLLKTLDAAAAASLLVTSLLIVNNLCFFRRRILIKLTTQIFADIYR